MKNNPRSAYHSNPLHMKLLRENNCPALNKKQTNEKNILSQSG